MASVSVTRLVLVRHGHSRAALDKVVGGVLGCRGLSDRGRAEAGELVRRLAATGELAGTTVLVSSTLRRAVETAEIIAPALGNLPVAQDPALRELDPGEGDGLTWAQWEERFGAFDPAAEPYRPLSPGGESWAAFGRRARRGLARLADDHPGTTVVACCHGGVIEQSLVVGLGRPALTPPGAGIRTAPNASLTEWRVEIDDERARRWCLVRFADAAHLGAPCGWR